jgi:CDGSH-type Zn-finger protein
VSHEVSRDMSVLCSCGENMSNKPACEVAAVMGQRSGVANPPKQSLDLCQSHT